MEEDNEKITFFTVGEATENDCAKNIYVQEIISETVITVQCGVEEKPDKSEGKKDVTRTKPKKRFACTQCSARYTKNLALTKHINSVHLRLKVE